MPAYTYLIKSMYLNLNQKKKEMIDQKNRFLSHIASASSMLSYMLPSAHQILEWELMGIVGVKG